MQQTATKIFEIVKDYRQNTSVARILQEFLQVLSTKFVLPFLKVKILSLPEMSYHNIL